MDSMQRQHVTNTLKAFQSALDPTNTWTSDLERLYKVYDYLQAICDCTDTDFASRSMQTNASKADSAIKYIQSRNGGNIYNPVLHREIETWVRLCQSTLAHISRNIPVFR